MPRWFAVVLIPIISGTLSAADFASGVKPFLQRHCVSCHNGSKMSGDVVLDRFGDEASAKADVEIWERVLENVRSNTMPPPSKPRPTNAEIDGLVGWIEKYERELAAKAKIDPGRVTIRRLNRAEYNNTIRDLMAVNVRPADDFPTDDSGYGFDNIADALTLPPLLLEKYLSAAELAVEAAFVIPEAVSGPDIQRRFQARELKSNGEVAREKRNARKLTTAGEFFTTVNIPESGEYRLRARAYEDKAGNEHARLAFRVDGKDMDSHFVNVLFAKAKNYESKVRIEKGQRRIGVAFTNDFYDKNQKDPKNRDRNLGIFYFEIEGPIGRVKEAKPTESYKLIMVAEPNGRNDDVVASRIIRNFSRRAFRRPVSNDEVERLLTLYREARKAGDDFQSALKLSLQAVLVSPHFLFRIERDASTDNPDGIRMLGGYEIASRLSYFLWSSMPDDELISLASREKLTEPTVLSQQVKRMLQDPKARGFVENFAGQWLQTRALAEVYPDREVYPNWDEPLRAAMIRETELFFEAMIRENRKIEDFLVGNFTYVNGRLARHYGIRGIRGNEYQRVETAGTMRGGVLTQASFLTLTSNPGRTSPVKRGKWILENILNAPPPPPPPGVADLDDEKRQLTGSLRQRMEQHRANPTCNSCHQRMDPLGFAFENFDGIGSFRTHDGKEKIDASGELPTGERIKDADDLKKVLMTRLDQFRHCLAEKLLVYALGRGFERFDRPTLERICRNSAAAGDTFPKLIEEVVLSDAFRKRKNVGTDQ